MSTDVVVAPPPDEPDPEPEDPNVGLTEPKDDLISIFTKPITEATTEELHAMLTKLQGFRKIKIGVSKKKSPLDLVLDKLTPENARALLQQLEAADAKKEEPTS